MARLYNCDVLDLLLTTLFVLTARCTRSTRTTLGDTDFADIFLTALRGGVLVVPLCDGRGSVRYAPDEGVTSR